MRAKEGAKSSKRAYFAPYNGIPSHEPQPSRVAPIGDAGTRPQKEDLLRSEIHSYYEEVCMYIFDNIANIA